ncbi:MAG: hypothetical protein Q7S58_16550 [Candidatus Binatus sp.]|uniref:hypothetical protein n=1 Tax=Candidatus Binatus sp. TaxID=2811406 RepID=UPI002727D39F|nr:hypothetical protein [Candidatus Binatus sp.]MDO8434010.1 hypothetical protein [Candidatus Binatus sp.]
MDGSQVLTLLLSALVSALISALVALWFGPYRTIREERAKRTLVVRDEIVRALQLLLRHLRNAELQNRKLAEGGQATVKWFIRDYERMLWPVVRALDNPDIAKRLAKRLRPLMQELLGLWRMEYLAICVTDNLENALDRYPIQPPHIDEPISVLERLCGVEIGKPKPAAEAVAKVEEMIDLLR